MLFAGKEAHIIAFTRATPALLIWSHFFSFEKTFFTFFFIILRDIIGLENFLLSFSQS